MTPPEDPKTPAPLTPATFHIILALAEGPAHGYAVMQKVEEMSAGRVALGPGTLYRTIQKMSIEGLIIERQSRKDAAEAHDDRRRVYALTANGRRSGRIEARRLAGLVDAAHARGLIDTGAPGRRRGSAS